MSYICTTNVKQNTMIQKIRIRKSVKLTAEELKAFKKWLNDQPTKLDASITLAVALPTIDRVIMSGGGHEFTINKVRKIISSKKTTSC